MLQIKTEFQFPLPNCRGSVRTSMSAQSALSLEGSGNTRIKHINTYSKGLYIQWKPGSSSASGPPAYCTRTLCFYNVPWFSTLIFCLAAFADTSTPSICIFVSDVDRRALKRDLNSSSRNMEDGLKTVCRTETMLPHFYCKTTTTKA